MGNEEENKIVQTPVQSKGRKTLGIRYRGLKHIQTPISEIRLGSKNISSETISPRTPFSAAENTAQIESRSTGHLPTYKLSLTRRLKKKRLQFTESTEFSPIVKDSSFTDTLKIKMNVPEPCEPEMKKSRCDIKSPRGTCTDEKHKQKVEELKKVILIWKEGFKNVLDDLSKKIEPTRDKIEILELLNIPLEMMKYA